jgi:acyl carrier protein
VILSENPCPELIVMKKSEVEQRVKKVVCQVLGVSEDMLTPESHFVFDLGAESTQSVELVAAFEAEFNIEMDDEAALSTRSAAQSISSPNTSAEPPHRSSSSGAPCPLLEGHAPS